MKLTVASSFPIHPPRGGGQERIAGLYRAMGALGVEVEVVTLAERRQRARRIPIGPGVTEVRVPMTPAFERADLGLRVRSGVPSTDLALTLHHDLVPDYVEALRSSARDSVAVVASHPFSLPAIEAATDRPLIYEAHNVEADLKRQMFEGAPAADELAGVVEDVERRAVERSAVVLVCSEDDRVRLQERYGLDPARTGLVPNGADPEALPYTAPQEREALRARLGLGPRHVVFVGSWHEPNLIAVRAILDAARRTEGTDPPVRTEATDPPIRTEGTVPPVRWLVLGSVGRAFAEEDGLPASVDLAGPVDERFLGAVLRIADVAVNPMRSGSGTNLKMLTYALAGVPIVSSNIGARGLGLLPGVHFTEAGPDDLAAAVATVAGPGRDAAAALVPAAREHALERFSWPRVAARAVDDVLRPALA